MVWGLLAGLLVAAAPAAQGTAPAAEGKGRAVRIAVLDVQPTGAGDRKTVEGLSPLLASEVARRPGLTVVAGSDLRALVGFERQKQLLGCTEGSCLTEIAGALGVSYLVASECSKVGNTWLLSLSLLDAGKAVALKRLTRRAYTDDSLVDEAVRAVDELLTALPMAGAAVPLPPPPAATAPPPPAPALPPSGQPPGYRQHDGFYLSLQAGFGALRTTGGQLTISGPAGAFSLALGGAVARNLALYAVYYADVDTSPTFKSPLGTVTDSSVTHSLAAFGGGVAWYSDSNWFLSASLAAAQVSLEASGNTGSTKWGPAFRLAVGKEWWVSSDWGIGVAIQGTGASNKDQGLVTASMSSSAFSLCVSATYN